MDNKKIGQFICKLRTEKKWTQEDLANKLFVDRTMVSKWERGVYIPSTEILLNMQSLFKVSINEILYGERKDKKNNEEIDSIPLSIIKEERRKKRKIIFISLFVIFVLIFLFFGYYFFNNYNSIRVYSIHGQTDSIFASDWLLMYSKEKSYLVVGNVTNTSDKEISKIKLFFEKDGEEQIIMYGGTSILNSLYVNLFEYDEYFSYDDLKYIISGLKMEIELNTGEKEIVNLKLKKEYSNNKLFESFKHQISDKERIVESYNVPKYIKDNFSHNSENESYERKSGNVLEQYFYEVKFFLIKIDNGIYDEQISVSMVDKTLDYNRFEGNEVTKSFAYNLNTKSCIYNNCDMDLINKINNKYLSFIYE